MTIEIPQYGLRAYALFYSKHGSKEQFKQSDLDWIVSQSMKKKIFALLLNAGWIRKASRDSYTCVEPENAVKGLVDFRFYDIITKSSKPYALTGMSAVEVWSDFSYMQRGFEKSPYFLKVLKKDLPYWKSFFGSNEIPFYLNEGSTVGEYVVLIPANSLKKSSKDGFSVEPLKETLKIAKTNEMHSYAYKYMRKKYGASAA
jgi:hypothetical protein